MKQLNVLKMLQKAYRSQVHTYNLKLELFKKYNDLS